MSPQTATRGGARPPPDTQIMKILNHQVFVGIQLNEEEVELLWKQHKLFWQEKDEGDEINGGDGSTLWFTYLENGLAIYRLPHDQEETYVFLLGKDLDVWFSTGETLPFDFAKVSKRWQDDVKEMIKSLNFDEEDVTSYMVTHQCQCCK